MYHRMRFRIAAALLAVCVMAAAFPGTALAAGSQTRTTHTANNVPNLDAIVAGANDGDVIEISGQCTVNDHNSDSAPWVINKAVTIRGVAGTKASIDLRAGGIILGKNVTFENLELSFTNRVRNAIMANGHTLTLRNVAHSQNVNHDVHFFCGGVTGLSIAAQPGNHGEIIIDNCPQIGKGNVYAGSISTKHPNSSPIPATVRMIGTSQVGKFYACGALETLVPDDEMLNPNYEVPPPAADPEQYRVTGDVAFHLYNTSTSMVDGATGGDKNAAVVYTGKGNLNDGLTLNNLSSLTVGRGEDLKPTTNSSLDGAELVVPADSVLNLTNLTNLVFAGLQGGGDLVLGKGQTLNISGIVSGTTRIGTGGIFNGASTSAPEPGHVYVRAPQSADGDFKLLCPSSNPNLKLVRDSAGDWTVEDDSPGGEEKPPSKLVSLSPVDVQLTSQESVDIVMDGISIPLNTVYTGDPLDLAEDVLQISVNRIEAQFIPDDNWSYYEADGLRIHVGDTGTGNGDELFIYDGSNPYVDPVSDGVYQFDITVPGAYTSSGTELSASCTLTVGDNVTPPPASISVPVAKTGLKWTGREQTGVEEGTGYTLTGHKETAVGSYTASAALEPGYVWSDGTTTAKDIPWSIAKADGPAAPTGLSAVPSTSAGGADGKILGVTAAMEYATQADFSNAQPCTGTVIANLTPRAYFVRLRETQTHEAGAPASITVPDFNAPTVASIQVNSTGHKTSYEVNSPLDVTGLTIEALYSDQSKQTVLVTENMVSGFDSSTAGSKTLTITYEGKKTTYVIEVKAEEQPDPDPNHTHSWSVSWSSDSSYHWHNCQAEGCPIAENREKEGYGSHNAGAWITDQAATSSQPGSRHKECTVCGYVTARQTVPATGGGFGGGGIAPQPPQKPDIEDSAGGSTDITPVRPGETATIQSKPDQGYEVDKITVTDQNGKPVEVTVKPDGTYTFKQPNGKVKVEVTYKPVSTPWSNPFTDVSQDDWYYEAVQFVQEEGLMNGCGSGNFAPNLQLSRAQLAQILFNKKGRPGVDYLPDFSDVGGEAWYTGAVRWAASQGIVGGYGDGTFGPDDPITREQLAVMLWRYSGSPAATNKELHFTDEAEISSFALEALRWAVENGILNGSGDGRLGPQGQATRAQVAQMLKNFIENQEDSAVQ